MIDFERLSDDELAVEVLHLLSRTTENPEVTPWMFSDMKYLLRHIPNGVSILLLFVPDTKRWRCELTKGARSQASWGEYLERTLCITLAKWLRDEK